MASEVRTGTLLAGFRVESLLGDGALGAVYLAAEPTSGRRRALKLLAPAPARADRCRPRRRLLARLRPVRVPGRCPAVRSRERALRRLRPPQRTGAATLRSEAGASGRLRRRLCNRLGEDAGRALLHVRRAGPGRERG